MSDDAYCILYITIEMTGLSKDTLLIIYKRANEKKLRVCSHMALVTGPRSYRE